MSLTDLRLLCSLAAGTARDVSFLIDFLPAYLYPLDGPRRITDFWMTGMSLGGHATWLALRHDPRISLGIPIVGCAGENARSLHSGCALAEPVLTDHLTH